MGLIRFQLKQAQGELMQTSRLVLSITLETDDVEVAHIDDFKRELVWLLPGQARLYSNFEPSLSYIESETHLGGAGDLSIELLITIAATSSGLVAAIIAALHQAMLRYLERNSHREITLEIDGRKVSVKGHSLPEESELLKRLFPEEFEHGKQLMPSRLDSIKSQLPDARIRLNADKSSSEE
jgi:hypothetical protein